ncbi:MAG: alanine racemase [Acidobacteriota bacterium]|nr:MAG: alanine racemase [Acidobacteriota bacterium]
MSWVEIDLDALAENVRSFRTRIGSETAMMAVVKSNAYGHGVELVAPAALEAGASWMGVGNLREALELRALIGERSPILILQHVARGDLAAAVRAGVSLTLYDADALGELEQAARASGREARLHLKLETGTHRQGLDQDELIALARELSRRPGLVFEGLSTHFADIEDTTDHSFALGQIERFRTASELLQQAGLRPRLKHIACSASTILFPATHLDLARVGIGLYGLWPSRETLVSARERALNALVLEPVLSWKTIVAQVKSVPAGGYVGYGRTWRATRPSRIAVLPIGYYEGYDRRLSGRAHVLIRGQHAPVVGRICMNVMMIDVTDVVDVRLGDEVVLIGCSASERVRADDLASWAGTIHYEIVSRLHASLPRIPVRSSGATSRTAAS